ncbi:MAG: NAD-dependent dehydratase [Chloroflexi bacterium HGW-Chloroflexi-4]|nr:MAG: NAD-dependent dehydratase [Chloroflexi bacterium HGW-Chloroflexi-4]
MKVLFIGGTGIISTACAARAIVKGIDLTLLNRGKSARPTAEGAAIIHADIHDIASMRSALAGKDFDAVVDWIAYTPHDVQKDIDLFSGKTGQFVFISSASAYQTPASNLPIRESTPLENPFWDYSRNKIACEELLVAEYRKNKFPFTIVRPSHTYDRTSLPIEGGYTVIDRMLKGKPVIVHGDGTSIWTLTHNTDFAKGFVGLLGNSRARGEIFHITSDEWLTWNQIHNLLGEAAGVTPQLVHIPSDLIAAYDQNIGSSLLGDKTHSAIFDNSKIKQVVPEFVCTVPFSLGAKEIIGWHNAEPSRQKIDPKFDQMCDLLLSNYQKAWLN